VQVREGTSPTEQNRRMMHGYMALISSIDDCFGQLLQKLKERGMDENTIVVYTSDHGDEAAQESVPMMVSSLDQWRGVATRDWIYSYNPYEPKQAGIRTYNVLYNRRSDPHCRSNLFGDPAYKPAQEEMHRLTRSWMERFEDPFMPYGALRDATIDPADIGNQGYIDFWNRKTRGILREHPVEAGRKWAAER